MITHVSLSTVYVTDQDAAKAFYVDKLGFVETADITLDDGYRWCTVAHPDHPELELTLMVPGPPMDGDLVTAVRSNLEKGSLGGVGLSTDDCRATHAELVAKGVEFVQEPSERPYGVEAILRDNSGNWLVLVERKPYDGSDFPHS